MTIYRQFRVTYRKRLLVYSLLCVALATGNALFWLHKWHEQGVELCFADTMMTGVQPSFLLMLLIPPTLGLVHQLKFILEQPFVICALDNRARLARNLLAALLFIAFRAVMAVSIPSIALGALLFRGGKPCTCGQGNNGRVDHSSANIGFSPPLCIVSEIEIRDQNIAIVHIAAGFVQRQNQQHYERAKAEQTNQNNCQIARESCFRFHFSHHQLSISRACQAQRNQNRNQNDQEHNHSNCRRIACFAAVAHTHNVNT